VPTSNSCPTCGAGLTLETSPGGLWPACLLSGALEDIASPELDYPLPTHLAPGSTLGPFRIIGVLGKGGMAVVYEAYDSSLERSVALKVLPPEFLHDGSFARRFRQEGRVVARLEHPNIVPIYTSGIDDGIAWMSMRLLAGGSLGGRMQRERPSPEHTVQILRAVADALDYAHARGVIHRDIKPTNILLDQADHVCVADFGLAYMMDFNLRRSTRTLAGTPHYMAPELGLGKDLDHRCDIYSLGVMAYEMLAGEVPFTADSPMAILLKHVNEEPPHPTRAIAAPLFRAVQKALAKDPAERWSSAGAFASAMESGLTGASAPRRGLVARRTALAVGALSIAAVVLVMRQAPRSEPVATTEPVIATPVDAPQSAAVLATPAVTTPSEPPAAVRVDPPRTARPQPAATQVVSGAETATPTATPVNNPVPDPAPTVPPPISALAPSLNTPTIPSTQTAPPAIERPPEVRAAQPSVTADVVIPPRRIRTVAPDYPPVARAAQIAGDVALRATLGVDGKVTDATVLRSVHPLLDQAARRAVLQYGYTPALRNGTAEPATVEITVSFRLE